MLNVVGQACYPRTLSMKEDQGFKVVLSYIASLSYKRTWLKQNNK